MNKCLHGVEIYEAVICLQSSEVVYDLQSTGDANNHQNKPKNSHHPLLRVTSGPKWRGVKIKKIEK